MTLGEYLDTIKSDPADPASPALLWWEDDGPGSLVDDVLSPTYASRPYALTIGLQAAGGAATHDRHSIMSAGVDVLIRQPPTVDMALPDPAAIGRVMAAILNARRYVTHAATAYPLIGGLTLVTEIQPEPVRSDPFKGLQGILRFAYQYRR